MSIGPPHSDNPLCKKTQAAESNKGPIMEVLKTELPQNAIVLEIGSGTGQHGATFCASLPSISWIPSDISTDHFESIISWGKISEGNRMSTPRIIDASLPSWDVSDLDVINAIVAINVVHISNFNVTLGILNGAQKLLNSGGILYFYGPFFQNDICTAESNKFFDQQLRAQNEGWGLRNLDEITLLANDRNISLDKIIRMPKNNLSVIFRKI